MMLCANVVTCCAGYSPFPGNINQLVIKLSSYVEQLAKTGAQVGWMLPYKSPRMPSFST